MSEIAHGFLIVGQFMVLNGQLLLFSDALFQNGDVLL